jgi:hypothetical protein
MTDVYIVNYRARIHPATMHALGIPGFVHEVNSVPDSPR